MEIEFRGQKKTLNEVKYLDMIEVHDLKEKEGLRPAIKKLIVSLGFDSDEAESLTLQEGISLQAAIDELTKDFQLPAEKKD